ncbi:MAG: hypothetical protein KGS47_01485 [Chloroflexi bacterium]|nr:hypothetical protein [Chloroflexota bacterium]
MDAAIRAARAAVIDQLAQAPAAPDHGGDLADWALARFDEFDRSGVLLRDQTLADVLDVLMFDGGADGLGRDDLDRLRRMLMTP